MMAAADKDADMPEDKDSGELDVETMAGLGTGAPAGTNTIGIQDEENYGACLRRKIYRPRGSDGRPFDGYGNESRR